MDEYAHSAKHVMYLVACKRSSMIQLYFRTSTGHLMYLGKELLEVGLFVDHRPLELGKKSLTAGRTRQKRQFQPCPSHFLTRVTFTGVFHQGRSLFFATVIHGVKVEVPPPSKKRNDVLSTAKSETSEGSKSARKPDGLTLLTRCIPSCLPKW